jgi:membrane fusion protein (multidrug efflux system)
MNNNQNNTRTNFSRIMLAIGFLMLIGVGIFLYWYIFMRGIVFSDDARFGGHLVDLSPEVNGILTEVLVKEGDHVKKGQKIFQIDPSFFQVALTQALGTLETDKGKLAVAQARYARALHGARIEEIMAAEATFDKLTTEEQLAELEYKRIESLGQKGAASQDQIDRSKSHLESAQHARENALQNLILLQKGTRKEDINAAQADLQAAKGQVAESQAAVDKAQITLERASVYAPFDGWVVRRWLDPGANVTIGRPVLSLFDPATLRVEANIEEKYLNQVAVGDEVDISVDAFPDLKLKGRVSEILRATNSEFSLIPAEGVSGTYIKVTQRVPLRISVQAPNNIPLGPGLSVEVRIHVGTAAQSKHKS